MIGNLQSRFQKIGDFQLEVWDTRTGAPMVFIHGVGTSGELWAANLAELATDFRIIAYNRRGYGASSLSPRNWGAHANDTIALIESLNAVPVTIVGYSAGASIALDVALRRPDLTSRIVLLDPAFNVKQCLTLGLVRTRALVMLLHRLGRERTALEHWFRYVSSYSTGGSAFESKASDVLRKKILANADGIFADLESDEAVIDESRLGNIGVPVTIIEAKLSPPFLRRSSQRLKRLLPQVRNVTLENSGHWVALDSHDEMLKVLRDAAQ
jgi:pimeloyl-ACP methyl ester carboxylesterase